ncbi:hypothetical protein ACFW9U_27935 [Rhodococcus aetherivorans]|uniref:hypothetical protein n=1 Tax=Rhodococcus aetherivorans TaxID=191292 RepID=UPI0036720023
MDTDTKVGRMRRWSTGRLRRFLRECDVPCALCFPDPALEVARIELARRRDGGTLDWRCRVTDPDGHARTMTVPLAVGLTPTQLHAAALTRARRRHGPGVQVQVLAVDDEPGAPQQPPASGAAAAAAGARAPTGHAGRRVHRCGHRRPTAPALVEARD